MHGWLARDEIGPLYSGPPTSSSWRRSGRASPRSSARPWPTAPSPSPTAVSSIPQVLTEAGVGATVDPLDVPGFVAAASRYLDDPEFWEDEHQRSFTAAERFSFTATSPTSTSLFAEEWGVELDTISDGDRLP